MDECKPLAKGRNSTYQSDRIIDGQREAMYRLRKRVLMDGQQPLRERLFRWIENVAGGC